MKVTRLIVKNIGLIGNLDLPINKPLLLFYGEVRAGKTTILNAVRWVFGGSFPDDLIQHGQKDASIELQFEGGSVLRSFYVAKDKTVKARDVEFVRAGRIVKRPVQELARFLNPFLLNQDHFREMSEMARKQYLTELFGVDTKDLDLEGLEIGRKAGELRARIEGYGGIEKSPAPLKPDIASIEEQIKQQREAHGKTVEGLKAQLADKQKKQAEKSVEHNRVATLASQRRIHRETKANTVIELRQKIKQLEDQVAEITKWLEQNPVIEDPEPLAEPDFSDLHRMINSPADTTVLDQQLANAKADQVRYEQWEKDQARVKQKEDEENRLKALEHRQREIKKLKLARLSQIAADSKVQGLAFNEDGEFVFEETTAGMLSTSQIMRLSKALSALYPEGFGLDLVDRAESLGKSIFDFIEKAKAEEKSILATIVGEAPAKVPADVGVFVVEKGEVKPAKVEQEKLL